VPDQRRHQQRQRRSRKEIRLNPILGINNVDAAQEEQKGHSQHNHQRGVEEDLQVELPQVHSQDDSNQRHQQQCPHEPLNPATNRLQETELFQRLNVGCGRQLAGPDDHLSLGKRAHLHWHALGGL